MPKTMYDSVSPGAIPTNAEIVAGYVPDQNQGYAWSQSDWDRFPHAIKKTIAIWSSDADILDIETGDATPDMAPEWARRQINRGIRPTLYMNQSTWNTVVSAINNAGLNGQVDYWVADYWDSGEAHLLDGAAAVQYADPARGSGGDWDLSLVREEWVAGTSQIPNAFDSGSEFGSIAIAVRPGG